MIVVHGIGNQRPGELADKVALGLADAGTCSLLSKSATEGVRNRAIKVQGRTVLVREANWAAESYPDNPPKVRLVPYLVRDFLETISGAWHQQLVASGLSSSDSRASASRTLAVWGLVTLDLILLATVSFYFLELSLAIESAALTVVAVLLAFGVTLLFLVLGLFGLYSAARSIVHRRRDVYQLLARPQRLGIWAVSLVSRTFLFMVSAYALCLLLVPVPLVVAVGYLADLPILVCARLGTLLQKLKLDALRRWLYRLSWVMVVMPVHTLAQAAKAGGNLLSILLTERNTHLRLAAVWWLGVVPLGFIVQTAFSEFLIVLFLTPLLPGTNFASAEAIGMRVFVYLAYFALYLLIVKALLTVIDLVLDIGNYHLARDEDRRKYFEPLEDAVKLLENEGCAQISIVAHSLGTVITYDWLRTTAGSHAITEFHTIGSPLNKFWYLDHPLRRREEDACVMARFPNLRWHNYWAASDVVSGRLTRYGSAPISDTRLRWLGPLFYSHVKYWSNREIIDAVRGGIVACAPQRTTTNSVGRVHAADSSRHS